MKSFNEKWNIFTFTGFLRSSSILLLFSILICSLTYFSTLSDGAKCKVYIPIFYLLFSYGMLLSSNYIWKCLVDEILSSSFSIFFTSIWKILVASFLVLSHLSQFTNLYGYSEPTLFQWYSWCCFGAYTIFLFIIFPSHSILWLFIKKERKNSFISYRRITFVSVFMTIIISISSITQAINGPDIFK